MDEMWAALCVLAGYSSPHVHQPVSADSGDGRRATATSSIVSVFRADPAFHDLDVRDTGDALVRHYHAQVEQRQPPAANLTGRAQPVSTSVPAVCERRLGQSPLPTGAEMVECLRRIQKSVRR